MSAETEPRRGPSRLVVGSVILLLLACGLVFALVLLYTAQPQTDQQTAAIHGRDAAFNLEQTTPNADAGALDATQEALLQGYGWIDKNAGVARIPIDRAMALIAADQPAQTATPRPQGN